MKKWRLKWKNHFFKICLWLVCGCLGADFNHFRNVSDHFWSTSDRFKPTGINYKQILKKWKFWFFSSEISSLIGSRVGGLVRIFPVYEGFKVELLQKICKSIHDVLSRMSALHSDDSISAFKNIGISWLQKVLALWMSPDELGSASKTSLERFRGFWLSKPISERQNFL